MENSNLVDQCCDELTKKMRVGKKRGGLARNPSSGTGSGSVRITRSMSSKRVVAGTNTPAMKKHCSEISTPAATAADKSVLESLPQDVLIRILCGVDHDDLKQLLPVSKSIKNAALIARQWHFAYRTPKKLQNSADFSNLGDIEDAPNAPKQERASLPRLSEKKLANITVALFA